MKIFEIVPSLGSGGAERFVIDLCNQLAYTDEVILVSLYKLNKKNSFFLNDLSKSVRIISLDKKAGLDFKTLIQLSKLILKEKPNIVHTHLSTIVYIILICLTKFRNIKFIHTVHSAAAYEAETMMNTMVRKFLFKLKLVVPVTISEESQTSFYDFYNVDSKLIYNGRPNYHPLTDNEINTIKEEINSIKQNKNSIAVFNVARLNSVKNQYVLAQAINNLNTEGHKIELFIIGEINHETVYKSLLKLNSPFVHIMGPRSNPRDYLKNCADVFCLSSLTEGMPITLIECFSVGTIPVCTPIGGMKDMITDGSNGLLSSGTECSDIQNVFRKFIGLSEEKKKSLRKESLESFTKFSIEHCAKKYRDLMREILKINKD